MWNLIFGFIFAFLMGLLIGSLITLTHFQREKITGILVVDHQTNECHIEIIGNEIKDTSKKRVIFLIYHNGTISQNKHIL